MNWKRISRIVDGSSNSIYARSIRVDGGGASPAEVASRYLP
jgi:hypothetical protein